MPGTGTTLSHCMEEADRHYTTFITPWGRYRYKTAPQGYIASGDGYTARYDALVSHIQSKTKCIDDALLWAKDIEEAYTTKRPNGWTSVADTASR